MNAVTTDATLPALIDSINLAQPLDTLKPEVFDWVQRHLQRAVYSVPQLAKLNEELTPDRGVPRGVGADVYFALGAIRALERRPADGWNGYVDAHKRRLAVQALTGRMNTIVRLRDLADELGGILINCYTAPFLLICPQPDRTWITISFESVMLFNQSPLRGTHGKHSLVRSHVSQLG